MELAWDVALYQAVRRADRSCDGRFYFAVATTGVYCYPSCSCRKPRPENVRFFTTRAAAEAAGFRPCKRCRPDLEGGVDGYERQLVAKGLALVQEGIETPGELARRLAVSQAYLNRLFRRRLGETVQGHLMRRRLERAADLVARGESVTGAAGACGFGSLSSFYAAFRRAYGVSPGRYRQQLMQ